MARSAEDYGIPDLDDATLEFLVNQKYLGEKGKYAQRELAARRGVVSQADTYRKALERAAYGDAGAEYGAGLKQVSNYLASSGPMADSGGATALRRGLYSDVYGKARSRIGQGYAGYLANAMNARRSYQYQRALQELAQKKKKKGPLDYVAAAAGGLAGGIFGGPPGAAAGASGGYQASDAIYA